MAKRFLRGVALGGLLGALGVWMHTTPKGRQSKTVLEQKIKVLWSKVQKEYHEANPDGLADLQKDVRGALRSWTTGGHSTDIKKALIALVKKMK